jgi:Carboxypeptidase regulatory-like domain
MIIKCLIRTMAILVLVGIFAAPIRAQVITATVRGVVKDPSDALLPGARVTMTNTANGSTRSVTTDASGAYEITSLAPGNYQLAAERAGFKRFVRSGIQLTIGQEVNLPLTMELGAVTQQVEVTSAMPLVNTQNASVSGLVGGSTIREMPLNGRSFDQLAQLSVGVSAYHQGGQNLQNGPGVKMSISGGRPESIYWMLDGTNILGHSNFSPGSAAGNNLGVDAIQEFRVYTHDYSAEIGVRGSGAVSIVSRSGTNQFHGTAYEFYRNSKMDVRNFFDIGSPPPFNRHQYGGSIGGPIKHDKTFFFANVEHLRERLGQTLVGLVPNAAARQGILPSGNVVVNPTVVPYLKLFPLPNGPDLGDGTAEFFSSYSQPTNETYYMGRVDQRFSDKDSLFGRVTADVASVQPSDENIPGWVESERTQSLFTTIQETHIFRSNLLNEFRIAFNRTNPRDSSTGVTPLTSDPSLKFIPTAPEMGSIKFSVGRGPQQGGALSGIGVGTDPRTFTQNIFEYTDDVTQIKGRHSLRYGADIQRIQFNGQLLESPLGTYSFIGLASFLEGLPAVVEEQLPGSDGTRGFRQTLVATFIQDNYKLRPNLTLNLGLRWEFTTIPSEVHGHVANLFNVLDPSPRYGVLLTQNSSLRDLAPRFGLAWDPTGSGKMAVRLGGGIFFSQVMGRNYYTYALHSPYDRLTDVRNPPFPNPFANGFVNAPVENDRIDPNLKTPTVYQYSLIIERQFLGNFSASIGYVGSHGVHLLRNYEGNTAIPTILPGGTPFYPPGSPVRNPNFGPIFTLASDSISNYNSLQASIQKRFSHGLQFQMNYTWGKSTDDASCLQKGQCTNSIAFTQYPQGRAEDKGLSTFNIAQLVSADFTYDLPRLRANAEAAKAVMNGWELGGIVHVSSGIPLDIVTGFSRSGDGQTSPPDRPNLKPGESNNPVFGRVNKWFDPTAFELPPPGFYGNLGRDTVIGPGMETFDMSLVRHFRFGREGMGLDFRFEVFNLLNHANFGNPRTSIFNSKGSVLASAGLITTTITSSRQIQLGLKFKF